MWEINGSEALRRQDEYSAELPCSQNYKWASRQQFYGNFMHHADAFDHAFFGLNPREAVYVYPQQRLVLEMVYQAVKASFYLRVHK